MRWEVTDVQGSADRSCQFLGIAEACLTAWCMGVWMLNPPAREDTEERPPSILHSHFFLRVLPPLPPWCVRGCDKIDHYLCPWALKRLCLGAKKTLVFFVLFGACGCVIREQMITDCKRLCIALPGADPDDFGSDGSPYSRPNSPESGEVVAGCRARQGDARLASGEDLSLACLCLPAPGCPVRVCSRRLPRQVRFQVRSPQGHVDWFACCRDSYSQMMPLIKPEHINIPSLQSLLTPRPEAPMIPCVLA
ncbi:hypothetical protein E2C01_040193 [Portunus trituberculatus]|uniref:Uncharacterized protein n=1 Tax=Portunus trituberculatus TaxID=210409 RepID=A0A5B7FN44_PORTR|nr:hypothetical protein [Portunus trituberculatus]